ncbi:MAG: chemotaxis protein CheX [Spirochaetes bacterium GWF1_31_7]|nr:MAG: chemotaxis protein CheX [Spirochaetes bacterium GWE1_32_154]OHD50148.1 MAG: chemotaxis protein CheX [Spirochaetes bacterium GWE2_31_10]OHD52462.1 MAG: chemotaxis protein CheX [Spirochaetes bacterium GWF1_31_7]OHD81956.1 MAG: chemotaxis protein CheX [Spirochaetes bacterium RIFOXYB1_FULL_32_8]HBD96109.1 chemotaxis protein CheX [Spirochaetia bacterium]
MRVEYINPFVESSVNVLKEVLGLQVRRENVSLKSKALPVLDIAVIVGLVGQVEGRVIFDLDRKTALNIASKMNDETLTEFDDLAKATITELGNMITGRAVTKLSELGYKFDVTPPAIFTGNNMEISDVNIEALIVPIETELGRVEVNVALREKA